MDPSSYLERHHIMTYITDAVTVLATKKRQDPVAKMNEIALLSEYFEMLKVGAHVYGREFEYITATPYNRSCFIRLFWQCFYSLSRESVLMKVKDYLQMLRLLCPNFPAGFLTKMKNILLHSANRPDVELQQFIYTFQVLLYYDVFLAECEKLYKWLLAGAQDKSQVSIVVPRTDEAAPATSQPESGQISPELSSRGFDANEPHATVSMFAEQVLDLRHRLHKEGQQQCLPQSETLRLILFKDSRVTSMMDLLQKLTHSDDINLEIGILPNKNVFQDTEPPPLPN